MKFKNLHEGKIYWSYFSFWHAYPDLSLKQMQIAYWHDDVDDGLFDMCDFINELKGFNKILTQSNNNNVDTFSSIAMTR